MLSYNTIRNSDLIPIYEHMRNILEERLHAFSKATEQVAGSITDISFSKDHVLANCSYTYHGGDTKRWEIKMPIELLDASTEEFENELEWAKKEAKQKAEKKLKEEHENRLKDEQIRDNAEYERLRKKLMK